VKIGTVVITALRNVYTNVGSLCFFSFKVEVCVGKSLPKSLQYVIKSCFSKIFQTRSDDVIAECMDMFKCLPVADAVSRRKRNFLSRFSQCNNFLCHLCCLAASIEF